VPLKLFDFPTHLIIKKIGSILSSNVFPFWTSVMLRALQEPLPRRITTGILVV